MALVQGGGGANIFCKSVYMYLSGMSAADIIVKVTEVGDFEVEELLQKVCGPLLIRGSFSKARFGYSLLTAMCYLYTAATRP